jgi:AraC family transcriptional regulator of adaptative response / DNA-3-methyladenine glycosylase II
MNLDNRALLYKIVRARDKRYDGRFFCAVRTTGIYCRPICPARPKLENISFYRSAAEAEKAGFRPCLRCRPDLAPSSAQWDGTAAIIGRALSLISRGEVDACPLDELSARLGISSRHLRRLFEEHLGASPIEVIASQRLHIAKHLLSGSDLPVTEIALASGYRSIRRFNEEFKERFRCSPSSLRSRGSSKKISDSPFVFLEIPVVAPFDWDSILAFLGRHRIDGVESIIDNKYRRCFSIGAASGALEVGFESKKARLLVRASISDFRYLRGTIEKVRDLFDARLNPHTHLDTLDERDPIAECYRDCLGIRIPGAWDPFETAIGIVLSQLVSVEQARAKVRKLVESFGRSIQNPVFGECSRLFPEPKALIGADLKHIGLTKVREQAVRELAKRVAEQKLNLTRSADIEETRRALLAIPGIGPWTTELIAMRCLGDTNAFPKNDLIIKRALEFHQTKKQEDWSPWNAYITLTLWKKYAATLSRKTGKPASGK